MIRAFILYYLNMKPTHGYEIQKFLQISGTEQWAKIQSGSIYYALTKLEKEKYIQVLREERTGSRVRKIYTITDNGKTELHKEMAQELDKPISTIGSIKFFTDPMLSTLSKDEIIKIVSNHINKLMEQKEFWERWYAVKVDETTLALSRISFEMTIQNIDSQILWHQELLEHLDIYIKNSKDTEQIIKSFDFDWMEEGTTGAGDEEKLQYALKLKNEILKDPQNAVANLDKIIKELQNHVKKG
ncbi:PadR family transcriptional regulator [Mobilitalea sibirica]|uniref:PadR family transcriptional regulator n=1 Tax=Mobilitalea sibirica TaxID=1462919 RepID=A0A8J7L224_9FIRM|nr:PadR family transcriptional regulator [Mobilitalea sibirica]MBH1939833.1 PadR family transcriptional regulator [Mobilitalea sibirica]